MKYIAYMVLVFLIALNVHAGEALLTIDAQEGSVSYVSEGPKEVEAVTKGFSVPKGWKMVEISHPDKIVCSAYAQPSTWEMKRLYVPRVKPAGLSAAGSKLLDKMGDTQ